MKTTPQEGKSERKRKLDAEEPRDINERTTLLFLKIAPHLHEAMAAGV
jgi:hypothetical protein